MKLSTLSKLNKMPFTLQDSSGILILCCGDKGMENDLVFAASGDEPTEMQKDIMRYILDAVNHYKTYWSNDE